MTTPDLMTPGQVAARFGVDPHTVTRWANAGRLPAVRTPGGHRRYRRADVEALATPGADLMTPGQVAARFGVDPHTVTRWANAGRLPAVRTPGGHRRYRRADVEALATPGEDLTETPPAPAPHRDALEPLELAAIRAPGAIEQDAMTTDPTPDPTTTPTSTNEQQDVREEWAERLQCADIGVDFPWLTEDGCSVWHEQSEEAQEHYRNLLRVALSAGLQIPPPAAVSAAAPDEREALDPLIVSAIRRKPDGVLRYTPANGAALGTSGRSFLAEYDAALAAAHAETERLRWETRADEQANARLRELLDEARAALAALRGAVKSEGYALQGLVSRYTRAPGENGDRVADLLTEDAWKAGTRLRALAAAPSETEDVPTCPAPTDPKGTTR